MACKIEIRQNLEREIGEKAQILKSANWKLAQKEAKNINASYEFDVVSVHEGENEYVNKVRVDVPSELVDKYHAYFTNLEQLEAAAVQSEDADRMEKDSYDDDYLSQKEEMPASRASDETLNMMKTAAKQMGINFELLADYAKANPGIDTKGLNGLANLVRGVVAVAHGMENVATTEEIIHIASAIIEQTDPKLITDLISKIDRFKIYNATLEAYKNNKNYQLANGKPNIRKIKKEAVDKLIAEVVVHQSEGSTEFPELMEEEVRGIIKGWWDAILTYVRSLFGQTNVDLLEPFKQVAARITSGNVGAKYERISNNTYLKFAHAASDDASKILEKYLGNFGIQVKDINEIKDKLGIDEVGFADLLSKIAYIKDKKDLPPIAGKFIAYMMQYNSLVKTAMIQYAKEDEALKTETSAIYYVAPGLGKTELSKINPNKFVDMDDLIAKAVKNITGKTLDTNDASLLVGTDEKVAEELVKLIKEVKETHIILSPISSSKLQQLGFNYSKYYIPGESNKENILEGIARRSTNPYDITDEEYVARYITPYETKRNIVEVNGYISDEFSNLNDSQEKISEYLTNRDYTSSDNYKDLDKDEYLERIGNLIADELNGRVNVQISKSLLDKIKDIIREFFATFKTNREAVDNINKNIATIVDGILADNKDFITASPFKPGAEGKPVSSVSMEMALSKDSFGKSIVYKLSKYGFILTGSTALSEQGTILRPDENPLHDIDWVSPFTRKETEQKFLDAYPDAVRVRDIYGDGYVTDSYLIAPTGYKILNYEATNYNGKIIIKSYDIANNKGDVVGTYRLERDETNKSKEVETGIRGKVIDFFSYNTPSAGDINTPFTFISKDGEKIQLANWKDTFKAKLTYARYKDIWDYNRFSPNENEINRQEGRLVSTSDIFNERDVYFQQRKSKDLVDNMVDVISNYDKRLKVNLEVVDASGQVTDKRHYMFDGVVRVAKSVTEKVKEFGKKKFNRTPAQKLIDDMKKTWGSRGHEFLEKFFKLCLLDANGYRLAVPLLDVKIDSEFDDATVKALKSFAVELINSYDPDTRFLIEKKVINTKVKGMIASAIDFIAIEPVTKKDGTSDIKVDILDWKFTSINKAITGDIPWTKQIEWKPQMGEYTKMLYNYGLKPEQLRKARMVPFIMNYEHVIPGNKKSDLVAESIEIGKLNSLEETNLYLLPVPINEESTSNPAVDKLLESLRHQLEKLYLKPNLNKQAKAEAVNELSRAIRILHLQLDFKPLLSVANTFINGAKKITDSFDNIDISTLSSDELTSKLKDLLDYQQGSEKFTALDTIFLSQFPKDGLDEPSRELLKNLEHTSALINRMLDKIDEVQGEVIAYMAVKQKIVSEDNKLSVLQAEAAVNGFAKTFLEGSKLSPKIIKLASNLIMNTTSATERKIGQEINNFEKILLPLEKEASAKGKKAFDLIGNIKDAKLVLIKKLSLDFLEKVKEAKENKNKKFFLDNMDVSKYNTLAAEVIAKGDEVFDNTVYSHDEEVDERKRKFRKQELRNKIDINSTSFSGYNDYEFKNLFRQVLKEEGNYSKEYQEMSKSKAALDAWNFFTELNRKAKKLGYLGKGQGLSFFPLIEASILEKFNKTSNILGQAKESFWTDFYTVKTEEEQSYSKFDKETGKLKKEIPKRFTRTNKAVNQLSTDLNKVGTLFIKSLLEFESARGMEDVLLTLCAVEKAKGSLVLDENGDVINESGVNRVDEKNNKNYEILQTIVDDYLYGLGEDLGSLGSTFTNIAVSKFSKDEESKQEKIVSVKKGLKSADTLVRALAVGLKPLIAIANWAGGQFQAFISAGNMYRFREFTKNNWKITTGIGLTLTDKLLLDYIHPLNEDVSAEQRRKLAKKKSFIDFLSTWTFTDVMMSTNSFPERKLQFANAMSFNDNSMVVNGEIINIRQYLKEQDRQAKKAGISYSERSALEKSFEDRVEKLKESSSLSKIAEIKNDELSIPGVSDEEIAKYRTKVIEYGRGLNGQMNTANKAGFRRDTILSSFMMFKTWIPKLVAVRTIGINKNIELDEWEYGRTRAFIKTWAQLGLFNVKGLRDIYLGTDEGLKVLDEMLEAKKEEHFRKTGQILEITNEEFHDLMRKQISDQFKEIGLLLGLMTMVVAAKLAAPDDDDDLKKNRYKQMAKALNKVTDEVSFYYDPRSADAITRGSIIPALGLFVKIEKIISSVSKEVLGYATDDQEIMDKAHPLKYFLNVVPVASQVNSDILPFVYPDVAKDWGIRVSPQSRMQ